MAAAHAHTDVRVPDSTIGQHGHHAALCQADMACLGAAHQQSPWYERPAPGNSCQPQVSTTAATFSQALHLASLASLPGRARDHLLKGMADPRYDPTEVTRRWPINMAYVTEMDGLQVGVGHHYRVSACNVICHTHAHAQLVQS